jgi:hypothetical protein
MGQVINLVDASFRRPADLPCTCSDAHLLEAVRGWLLNAPSEQVARLLGIKPSLLPDWINSHGWQQIVLLLREDVRAISYGAYGRLGLKAFQALEDRIDHGDPIVDSDGEIIARRPIKGKDLAEIISRLGAQQDLLEKKLGLQKNDDGDISLKDLAKSLKRFAEAKEIHGSASVVDQTGEANPAPADAATG